jgi:hypothetical protein
MYALMTSLQAEVDYRRDLITRDYETMRHRTHGGVERRWHHRKASNRRVH